ncbi:MAG: tetratricopeptide repeat protein [Candidatus Wallbacteria bacterium]|nr:tetratricopeptide repeat protein [Candidatus Wallbacteria bacterium]
MFTDVEGSTSLWDADAGAMREAVALHNALMRERLAVHHGYEVKTEGDAFMVAFPAPVAAVRWCLDCQVRLLEAAWPPALLERAEAAAVVSTRDRSVVLHRGLRVRMGIHLGTPDCVPDPTTGRMDYFGPMVNRAARVSAAAHGGQVIASDSVRAALAADLAGARVRPLGSYNLKGLSVPETLHEILPEALGERTFPPARGQPLCRVTLPRPASACLGRQSELAELLGLLRDSGQLITLLGPGGIGKTRLAVELGHRFAASSGQELAEIPFCDLTRAASTVEIAELAARAVGCPFGARATADALVEAVGAHLADRGAPLVILDNFEQVVRHAAATVGAWRTASPDTRFLVTSREPLGLDGERAYRLSSLDVESAVQLFQERVSLVRSSAAFAAEQRAAIEEIVRRLDGIPLALELAASRVGILSVEQLLAQLSQRFRLLASRRRDLTPRQSTLRGAIDWSWDLLSEAERRVLAQLAAFRGCTLEAAEAVVEVGGVPDAEWVGDLLQTLVDRSMVQAVSTTSGVRFHLLESIHEYASERLERLEGAADVRTRHARHFAHLAEKRYTGAFLDDDRIDLEELALERDNLAAALECPALSADDQLRLIVALAGHAYMRRPLTDLKALVSRGAELASSARSPLIAARALNVLGICLWLEGDHAAARETYGRALAEAERSGDDLQRAVVLKDLANAFILPGELEKGEQLLNEALVDRFQNNMAVKRKTFNTEAQRHGGFSLPLWLRVSVVGLSSWHEP